MQRRYFLLLFLIFPAAAWADTKVDLSEVRPGPVTVQTSGDSLTVRWPDETARTWQAEFSLDPAKPLIRAIGSNGKSVIERARPLYWCETGKRRGGWDAFFDFPPNHPDGTRRYTGDFRLVSVKARSVGDRVEVLFDGLNLGIFHGGIAFVFFPGTRLIQQAALVSTNEPDTAFFYETGLRMAVDRDRRPGGNMESHVAYYNTSGVFQTAVATGPDRSPMAARYRSIAAHTGPGSVAVFPPPHQYFFARDFTTNQGYVWQRAWKGEVAIGVRLLPDDNTAYYPWMNAPPGTLQRLSVFYLLSDQGPRAALADVLRYTNNDRFPALPGYKTLAAHWHFAYTGQAQANGLDWTPPFKPVLKTMGVDAAMINDFHGDGHPADLGPLRLEEQAAYFRAVRAQSDSNFLLIPAEEANVHLGGHWTLVFPKPVYWLMDRPPGGAFQMMRPGYGNVYSVANPGELLDMVRKEGGFMYQTHPRTKGSTGFPDKIRETEYFRDTHYFGAGWKAMPSDLSSPRLGERALKLLSDMNNWGLKKRLLGEVDVFQLDSTHELYAHMNVNYVRMDALPAWDRYGRFLDALSSGDYFVTTGEVLLPDVQISAAFPNEIAVRANVRWTFPLQFAEIVWGDGSGTFRKTFPLDSTRPFGAATYDWKTEARDWKWAWVAVWDAAGNGAFVSPVWK